MPHVGQTLGALVIIGESLALSPFLLRESLSEVMPGQQQLDGAYFGQLFPDFCRAGSRITLTFSTDDKRAAMQRLPDVTGG